MNSYNQCCIICIASEWPTTSSRRDDLVLCDQVEVSEVLQRTAYILLRDHYRCIQKLGEGSVSVDVQDLQRPPVADSARKTKVEIFIM